LTNKPLTDAAVRKYTPGPERRRIRDHGTPSLFLIIEPSGHRAFEMRFRTPGQKGKPGRIGKIRLGPYTSERKLLKDEPALEDIGAQLTLADARLLALKVTRERKRGHDVIGDHQARKERRRVEIERHDANSFAAAVAAYIDEEARPNQRSWRWTARLLGLHYGDDGKPEAIRDGLVKRWGDKPVASIDRALIKTVIKEARKTGIPGIKPRNEGKSEARARALFTAISSLFSWLVKEDDRGVEINPCAGMSRPDNAEERDRVLTDAEIRWFWQACDAVDAPLAPDAPKPFGPLLRTLLLTGARLNEVARMTYGELSDDRATWSLSGDRTKNKKPHVVPLAPAVRALIAAVSKPGADADYVFSTTGGRSAVSGWSRLKKRLDALMLAAAKEERADATIASWRLHDLRRTFVTGLVDLGVPPHVVELTVNHLSGTRAGVAGTYNKAEMIPERKAALARWAAHVAGLVKGRPAANVVTLKAPRKAR
jgi:integrase